MSGWPSRWVVLVLAAAFVMAFGPGWLLLAGLLLVPVLASLAVAVFRDWRDAADLRSLRHHQRGRW